MQPVIYLDVFFALNFLMDFFLLLITRKIVVNKKPLYRLTGAAVIGAIYSCIIVTIKIKYNIIEMMFTYLIVALLMVAIAFGCKKLNVLLRQTGLLYAVTFVMCGIINALYYRSIFSGLIDYVAGCEIVPGINLVMLIIGVIIAGSIVQILFKIFTGIMTHYDEIYIVTLFNNNVKVQVRALIDTGNDLFDPISGKPVSVINSDCIMRMMKGDVRKDEKFRAIPFHSVGKKAGIMEAYRIDYLEISKKEGILRIDNPIVAVYKGELSGNGEYEMLLNKKLIKI